MGGYMEMWPVAGAWAETGDDTTGGRDSRFDFNYMTAQSTATGGTVQNGGGGVSLSPDGQVAYAASPANNKVYEIDLRDGDTSVFVDMTAISPTRYPILTWCNPSDGDVFVHWLQEDSRGDYPTYTSRGGISRYSSGGGHEATRDFGDASTNKRNFLAGDVDYDDANGLIMLWGKGGGTSMMLIGVDPTFTDGGYIDITDGTNVRYKVDNEVSHSAGALVVLPGEDACLFWDSKNNWWGGDISSGPGGFTNHQITVGGGTAGPRRRATWVGKIGSAHYILGASKSNPNLWLTEATYNGTSSKWELSHSSFSPALTNQAEYWNFGSNVGDVSTNPLPAIGWTRENDTTDGAMLGRATLPDSGGYLWPVLVTS